MSKAIEKTRRARVERNIYKRTDSRGRTVFEVGYRDSEGRQRWRTVAGGITAARATRDDVLGRKGRGERVQPNPKLRFGEAADAWLSTQVAELRPATQVSYRHAVQKHLWPRWGRRRLDAITVDDVAVLIRELRLDGKSEWTITGILGAARRVFKFSRRRMNWHGENPVSDLESSERPSPSANPKRRIFQEDELAQTLAAAREPWKTLFSLAAVTGARLSECLGLVWGDVDLGDLETAEIRFEYQVDGKGQRSPLKTEESRRTVEIPRQLAAMLVRHKLASKDADPGAFVFATRTGRALAQRNVIRALRATQKAAVDSKGSPTFPVLHEDERVSRGAMPSFHSFRHTAASEAIAAGDSAEEVSWQLGHKSSVVTRTVYVQEIKSVERTARRRERMEARYGPTLDAAEDGSTEVRKPGEGNLVALRSGRKQAVI